MGTRSRRAGRWYLTAACGLAASLVLSQGSVAHAQYAVVAQQEAPLVSVDVRDASLTDVVAMLTQQVAPANIVIENIPDRAFNRVTMKVADQPLDNVLRLVAMSAGAELLQESGIFFIRHRGTPRDNWTANGGATAAPSIVEVAEANTHTLPAVSRPRGYSQTIKIPLMFAKPSDVVGGLHDPGWFTIDDDPTKMPRPEDVGRPRITPGTIVPTPIPIGPGTEYPGGGGGYSAGHRDAPNATAGQQGRIRGGGFGAAGAGGGQLGAGQAGGVGGGGGQVGAALLPEGIDSLLALDADNSLLVRGTPEAIDELRSIVRQVDVAPRQVMIKAEFVQVSVSDIDAFGIDWDINFGPNVALDMPTVGPALGGSLTLVTATGNAVARLRITSIRNTTNVLQAPMISATNLTTAVVAISNRIPIFTTVQQVAQGVVNNVTQVQYIEASNQLQVTPRINGDNSISMRIEPQLSSFTLQTGPGGQIAPVINTSSVSSYRRVANGETMVIGGFISKSESRSQNRTPFLSDLPIIGGLFRSRTRDVTGTETLVFLTPTIIEDRATGTIGTGGGFPPPTP